MNGNESVMRAIKSIHGAVDDDIRAIIVKNLLGPSTNHPGDDLADQIEWLVRDTVRFGLVFGADR